MGTSLVNGSLSPSRASDFRACPLRYRFRVIDRLPQRPSMAALRGTVVHAVLDRLFDLPAPQRTLQSAVELVPAAWQQLLETSPEHADPLCAEPETDWAQVLPSARKLLGGYFALEDPRRLQPAARECLVEVVLDSGLQLRGYLDRLDRSADGDLRIVDYKTGRVPGETQESAALFQLKFYALVLWRTTGRVPRELLLLYLDRATMLRYAPEAGQLAAFERLVEALWATIAAATASGDFPARPGSACSWCDHRSLCPVWGGTAPPLPPHPAEMAAELPPGAR